MATMESIVFDQRGVFVASAFFSGLLLVLAVVFLANLRRERLGRFGLSRRTRIVGFSVLTALYLATLYGWLFWRTFYELRVAPDAGRLELTVLMPERQLAWPLEQIAAIRRVAGSRAGFARLVVETQDGRSYRSPDRAAAEISDVVDRIRNLLGEAIPVSGAELRSGPADVWQLATVG